MKVGIWYASLTKHQYLIAERIAKDLQQEKKLQCELVDVVEQMFVPGGASILRSSLHLFSSWFPSYDSNMYHAQSENIGRRSFERIFDQARIRKKLRRSKYDLILFLHPIAAFGALSTQKQGYIETCPSLLLNPHNHLYPAWLQAGISIYGCFDPLVLSQIKAIGFRSEKTLLFDFDQLERSDSRKSLLKSFQLEEDTNKVVGIRLSKLPSHLIDVLFFQLALCPEVDAWLIDACGESELADLARQSAQRVGLNAKMITSPELRNSLSELADFVVTVPNAWSCSELLSAKKPILLLPIQSDSEEQEAQSYLRSHFALMTQKIETVSATISLFYREDRLKKRTEKVRSYRAGETVDSISQICIFLIKNKKKIILREQKWVLEEKELLYAHWSKGRKREPRKQGFLEEQKSDIETKRQALLEEIGPRTTKRAKVKSINAPQIISTSGRVDLDDALAALKKKMKNQQEDLSMLKKIDPSTRKDEKL